MSDARTPDPAKTAVVGLGQMGRGIARNLDAREMLVAAFDTRRDAVEAAGLSGRVARPEANADWPGDGVDVALFAVPSTDEVSRFLDSVPPSPGQLVIDVTTSDPARSRALAADLATRGISYVDAPMTGGAAGADAGTLTLMVGGDELDIAAARPVFDAIASRTFHLGPVGAGHAMKLAHNMVLHAGFLATCEGVRLAERGGIDPARAVEVLNSGNARSFVTEVRFPQDILSGAMAARSGIANLEKDLGFAMDFAADSGARAPFGALARTVLAEALAAGHADKDFSWLFPLYEDLVDRLEAKA